MNGYIGTRRTFLKDTASGLIFLGLTRKASARSVSTELGVADWKRNMLRFGEKHGKYLVSAKPDDPLGPFLGATYYDAQRVFYQIGDFTKDKKWYAYADAAMSVYRDRYVVPNKGAVPGYWLFSHGIAMNYERTQDSKSRDAVKMLAEKAAFAGDTTQASWTESALKSREVAYVIHTKLDTEVVGQPSSLRLPRLIDQALGHLNQWFVEKNAPYIQPFMVGLTSEALIRWNTKKHDDRVLPALKTAAASIWNNLWINKEQAFKYINKEVAGSGGPTPTPDLNLLIAPLFAWIYHQTGEVPFRDRAVMIFANGVKKAYLASGKQFNQNYRWSFDYLKWVNAKPLA